MQAKTNRKNNILIVDDHKIVLHGLKSLLSEENGIKCIDAVLSGKEALQAAKNGRYNMFIIDVELPDMSGINLLEQLRNLSPESAFIFHTMHDELWTIKAMLAAGADAIVFKSDDLEELMLAVREVACGNKFYSRHFEEYRCLAASQQIPSEREFEILNAIVAGESTNDISRNMCISPNTIEYHRKRLFQKLGATNMAEMVARAIERGFNVIKG